MNDQIVARYPSPDRETYYLNAIKRKFSSALPAGETLNIQPYQLRLEKVIENSNVAANFSLKQSQIARKNEIRLSDNDNFFLLNMAVGIYKEAISGYSISADRSGNAQIYHYPERAVFSGAATAASMSEADCLESVYNGILKMKAGTVEVLAGLQMNRFRVVPRTQYSATTYASYHGEQFVKMPLPVIMEGRNDNLIEISPAQGADITNAGSSDANFRNVMVVILEGFVLRNASTAALALDDLRKSGEFR